MSINNLISLSITDQEIDKLNDAFKTIESILKDKVVNLTPEERQMYGKLGDRTENWVKKVKSYMEQKLELIPFYINKAEFDKDYKTREQLLPMLNRVSSIAETMDDTAKLISTDVYNVAIAYYRNLKLISQQNVAGTTHIFEDLSSQFPGRNSHVSEEAASPNENTTN